MLSLEEVEALRRWYQVGGQIISRTVLGREAAVNLGTTRLLQHSLPSSAGRASPKALEIYWPSFSDTAT